MPLRRFTRVDRCQAQQGEIPRSSVVGVGAAAENGPAVLFGCVTFWGCFAAIHATTVDSYMRR